MDIDDSTGWQTLAWALPLDLNYLRRSGLMWQPGVFWRRRVFEREGGFDESLRYVADLDYWLRLGARSHRFLKVHEFLAIARIHPETLSLLERPKVIKELDGIRQRHAPKGGSKQRFVARLDPVRRPMWTRLYWVAFVLQSLVPPPIRRGAWARLLGAGQTNISYVSLLLRPVPGLGRRVGGPLLRPNRYWLEQS
jgi:hypothetical protein